MRNIFDLKIFRSQVDLSNLIGSAYREVLSSRISRVKKYRLSQSFHEKQNLLQLAKGQIFNAKN